MKTIVNLFIIIAALCLFTLIVPSCSDAEKTRQILENQGFKEISITGWRPWAKSEKDWWSTGFEATSLSGNRISGVVSGGILKGATIRFD